MYSVDDLVNDLVREYRAVEDGGLHTKQSRDRATVERWLTDTRKELAGEFAHD